MSKKCGDPDAQEESRVTKMIAFSCPTKMPLEYDVVIERDPDGLYIATVPALYGCRAEARSLDELMEQAREAILLRLEFEGPDPDDLDFVGVHRIRVA